MSYKMKGFCIAGVHTISVVIEGSEVGLIGENGTEIECSYPLGSYRQFSVSFWAFNKSSQIFEQIATYIPDDTPLINTKGEYLKGRVTLTPITKLSTKAVMTFNQIMCIDDTSYQCQARYIDSNGNQNPISNNTSISVEGIYFNVIVLRYKTSIELQIVIFNALVFIRKTKQ